VLLRLDFGEFRQAADELRGSTTVTSEFKNASMLANKRPAHRLRATTSTLEGLSRCEFHHCVAATQHGTGWLTLASFFVDDLWCFFDGTDGRPKTDAERAIDAEAKLQREAMKAARVRVPPLLLLLCERMVTLHRIIWHPNQSGELCTD
jgi:hypothetical protein